MLTNLFYGKQYLFYILFIKFDTFERDMCMRAKVRKRTKEESIKQ